MRLNRREEDFEMYLGDWLGLYADEKRPINEENEA